VDERGPHDGTERVDHAWKARDASVCVFRERARGVVTLGVGVDVFEAVLGEKVVYAFVILGGGAAKLDGEGDLGRVMLELIGNIEYVLPEWLAAAPDVDDGGDAVCVGLAKVAEEAGLGVDGCGVVLVREGRRIVVLGPSSAECASAWLRGRVRGCEGVDARVGLGSGYAIRGGQAV